MKWKSIISLEIWEPRKGQWWNTAEIEGSKDRKKLKKKGDFGLAETNASILLQAVPTVNDPRNGPQSNGSKISKSMKNFNI